MPPKEESMNRRLRWRVSIALAVILGVSVFAWYPPLADRVGWSGPPLFFLKRLTLGLDLKGGVQLVLRVNVNEALGVDPGITSDEIVSQARQTIDRRVNELGVVEPLIAVQGAN